MLLFTILVGVMIVIGLVQAEASSRAEGLRLLEESVKRAVVECYALEGRYPESIAHIEQRYGVIIDRSKYNVHYSIFAPNIMPDITVIDKRGGEG